MSKAVRIQEGILIRLIRKISTAPKTKERGFFSATDINLSGDQWLEMSPLAITELSLPSMPVINELPVPELAMITSENGKGNCFKEDARVKVLEPSLSICTPSQRPALPHGVSSSSDAIKVKDLVASLEFCEVPVQKVEELPSGATRISVSTLMHRSRNKEPELATVIAR